MALGGFSLAPVEFTHEGCIVRSMDDCNLNRTHLCKGLLEEDHKMLQNTYEIVIRLPDFLLLSSHGSTEVAR